LLGCSRVAPYFQSNPASPNEPGTCASRNEPRLPERTRHMRFPERTQSSPNEPRTADRKTTEKPIRTGHTSRGREPERRREGGAVWRPAGRGTTRLRPARGSGPAGHPARGESPGTAAGHRHAGRRLASRRHGSGPSDVTQTERNGLPGGIPVQTSSNTPYNRPPEANPGLPRPGTRT
jgi:hypothetical protein